jgi:multimeric flavodoxin WrbA
MKAIVALGSPRKRGNSAILAGKLIEGMESMGAGHELLFLHGMDLRPCTACDDCQKSMDTFCVIKDDMEPIYPKILGAAALVFATPVYWFTVSAQTKLFMDRLYAFSGPEGNSLKDKRIGILLTYGDTDPYTSGAVNAIRTFQDAFAYIGASIVGTVYGSAMDAGEIEDSPEVLKRAYELGKKLASTIQNSTYH